MKESVGIQGPASEVVQNALIALAVRCETEEPSYAIDCMIEHLCEPKRAQYVGNARPYTVSLDAAVTLLHAGDPAA